MSNINGFFVPHHVSMPRNTSVLTESTEHAAASHVRSGSQHAGKLAAITINRHAEIYAMAIGKKFADNPEKTKIRQRNMAAMSAEIREGVKTKSLQEFTPGWAIIGNKPGGVEGGFTVRRVYTDDMSEFFLRSPEGFKQLQKMSNENDVLLPAELRAKNLGDKSLLDALLGLSKDQQCQVAFMTMELTPAYQKSYMVKVVFGKDDVESSGTVFCKPNPKGRLHRMFTKRSSKDINKEVLQEFAALQVARTLSPELAPEALLGKIQTDGHGERFFLMTEMAGSGDASASFKTLGSAEVAKNTVDERFAGLSYALTVGLLGDRDANKDGNVGLLTRSGCAAKPFLFDLGHPDPNGYELDVNTLLPKRTSEGSTGFYLGKLNKSDILDAPSREKYLRELLSKRHDIESTMNQAIAQLPPDSAEVEVLKSMNNAFMKRMDYLTRILHNSAPDAAQSHTIDAKRRGSHAIRVFARRSSKRPDLK
ncbi:MAG: hypothetical protein LBI34_04055 [Puniceicoccales bacterium]|jgi:hypothetical protein|nr:hypothetical protein [Puniceicoccales bacterium]